MAACIEKRSLMHRKFDSLQGHMPLLFERCSNPSTINAIPIGARGGSWNDKLAAVRVNKNETRGVKV